MIVFCPACGKETDTPFDEHYRTLTFRFASRTKSVPDEQDLHYDSVCVLLFDAADGKAVIRRRIDAPNALTLHIAPDSDYHWWIIANPASGLEQAAQSRQESSFLESLVRLGEGEGLAMYDHGSILRASIGLETVDVHLKRYGCKVSIEELCVQFSPSFPAPGEIALRRIALVNAAGTVPYSATAGPVLEWYNLGAVSADPASAQGELTIRAYQDQALCEGVPFDCDCSLYALPNVIGLSGIDRPSRMAVELLIDGVSNWYPLSLPSMSCNQHFLIHSLLVTGPGSEGPDIPVSREEVFFQVEIQEWSAQNLYPIFEIID